MATARGYDARACQNRQPVLFHSHPGQGKTYKVQEEEYGMRSTYKLHLPKVNRMLNNSAHSFEGQYNQYHTQINDPCGHDNICKVSGLCLLKRLCPKTIFSQKVLPPGLIARGQHNLHAVKIGFFILL